MDVLGLTPTLPTITEEPVLVTVEEARTANVLAVGPRVTWAFRQKESVNQESSANILFTGHLLSTVFVFNPPKQHVTTVLPYFQP